MLTGSRPETGRLLDEYPYVRVGDGPQPLVVIPGVGDSMFSGRYRRPTGWALRAYFRRYLDRHSVYLVSRPRGLPTDVAIEDMAAGYARVIDEAIGPAAVLGLSMGGFVGQALARRRPDLVDRLVLAVSGCRIDEDGRPIVRRMLRYARNRDWATIRAVLAREMFADWRRITYPSVVLSAGRVVMPRPADPDDVSTSLSAALAYDGTDELAEIEPPTLVIGGAEDRFFPERILRETAAGIPDAELECIAGAKHGAFHERKATFDRRVRAFLGASISSRGTT